MITISIMKISNYVKTLDNIVLARYNQCSEKKEM